MRAAGLNAHALCGYMGHTGIQVYGHLFPGNDAEASALLDAYLERQFRLAARRGSNFSRRAADRW